MSLQTMAAKVIGWLAILFQRHSPMATFAIDLFNFVISRTSEQHAALIRGFYQEISPLIETVPASVRRFLLIADPPDEGPLPPGPVFADFRIQPQEEVVVQENDRKVQSEHDDPDDIFAMWFG
jgi:hypothetical protein